MLGVGIVIAEVMNTMTRNRLRWTTSTRAALSIAAGVLASCTGDISPQPEPPVRQSPPTVDFGAVEATVDTFSNGFVGLQGAPGSVSPPGATLRAVNLDNALDPVETVVAEDGSFDVDMSLSIGDEVRVQLFDGATRSDPIDVEVVDDEAPPVLATRALGDCLKLTPAAEIELAGGVGSVLVRNDCPEPVELGAPYARRPVNGLDVGQNATWPMSLPVGGTTTVTVQWGASATTEEVVFIEAITPAGDRRPITVR